MSRERDRNCCRRRETMNDVKWQPGSDEQGPAAMEKEHVEPPL